MGEKSLEKSDTTSHLYLASWSLYAGRIALG